MKDFAYRMLGHFDARSIRERVLIGFTAFAVTWGLWIVSIGGALFDSHSDLETSFARLNRDLQTQDAERERLVSSDIAPARMVLKRKQERLQALLITQQEELDELLTRFVPPEKIPSLLEDVLSDFSGLKLVSLASQPAQPLLLQADRGDSEGLFSIDAESEDALQVRIYRHPVRMEFEGGYHDVMAYLDALESGDWRFAWRRFDYVVTEYPNAQVVIELETLSREKDWLGV